MNDPIHNQPIIDDFEFELRGDTAPLREPFRGGSGRAASLALGRHPPVLARFVGTIRAMLDGLRGKTAVLAGPSANASRQPLSSPSRLRAFRPIRGKVRYRARRAAPLAGSVTPPAATSGAGEPGEAGPGAAPREGEIEAASREVDGEEVARHSPAIAGGGTCARARPLRSRRVRRHPGFGIPIT